MSEQQQSHPFLTICSHHCTGESNGSLNRKRESTDICSYKWSQNIDVSETSCLGSHFGKIVLHLSFKASATTVLSGKAHLHAAQYLQCCGHQFGLTAWPPNAGLVLSPQCLLLDSTIRWAYNLLFWALAYLVFPGSVPKCTAHHQPFLSFPWSPDALSVHPEELFRHPVPQP